jgi:cytochrome P450
MLYLRCFGAILHDPEIYLDPEEFKPERFLNEDGSIRDDPTLSLAFGVGKRICPGHHLAEAIIFTLSRLSCLYSMWRKQKTRAVIRSPSRGAYLLNAG